MQSSDDNSISLLNDSLWYLLAETMLPSQTGCEDDLAEQAIELLIEALQGTQLSHLKRIKATIEQAARNTLKHRAKVGSTLPVSIRLFAQKTDLEVFHPSALIPANVAREGQKKLLQDSKGVIRKSLHTEKHLHEGWGYFLIDRLVDRSSDPGDKPHYSIELFCYKEGK